MDQTPSRTTYPGPLPAEAAFDPSDLRGAYLNLLRLALCDLVSTTTGSVEGRAHGRLTARELAGPERSLRAEGRDWPRHGLTMTGLQRLEDLQRCVEDIAADQVAGDLLEAGAWRGGSSLLMRAVLDTLGERDRTVWVADSFRGFAPGGAEALTESYLAAFDFLAVSLGEVRESFSRLGHGEGVRFLPGYLADTLPVLESRSWSLLRLDVDTHDATLAALRRLYPRLSQGGYVIIDDYGALEECRAAVDTFRSESGITAPLHRVDWTCVRWRRPDEPATLPPAPPPSVPPPPAERPPSALHIPSGREWELEEELHRTRASAEAERAQLQDRLRSLENRLAEVTGSTSWRVTRPLRRLAMRARRVRAGRGS